MSRRNKPKVDLEHLASALETARTGVGYHIVLHDRVASVLMTTFDFDSRLVDTERMRAIRTAISDVAAGGPITRRKLESGLRRAESAAINEPFKKFVLASNLSFSLFDPFRPTQFAGGVRLLRHLPSKFVAARAVDELGIDAEDQFVFNYMGVLTRVRARSPAHAFELAINRADFLRGVWNFEHLRRIVWQSSDDSTCPLARIRFSRVHTLHESSGRLATPTYWSNPEFRKFEFTSLSDQDWNRMQLRLRSVQRRLPNIPYREDVERAFVHYGRALDATDMEVAFLKLWSVLELISGAGGERYDVLVRRASFLFKRDKVTDYTLEHLRFQRNEIVHLGTPQQEMRSLVFQLKMFVEQMLLFHLFMGRLFVSLEEAGLFMDLGKEPQSLRRKVALINRALRFRKQ